MKGIDGEEIIMSSWESARGETNLERFRRRVDVALFLAFCFLAGVLAGRVVVQIAGL